MRDAVTRDGVSGRLVGWKPKSPNLDIASTRIRCLNLLDELRRDDFPAELFDPGHADAYGTVVYSKLYDDASHAEAESFKRGGVRVIVDLCDNHFYNPRGDPEWAAHAARLRRMLDLADQVVVSTEALAEVVRQEVPGVQRLAIIPDALETRPRGRPQSLRKRVFDAMRAGALRRSIAADKASGRTPLVWFGHHGSPYADGGMLDLLKVAPALERVARRHALSLTVISNSREKFDTHLHRLPLRIRYAEWSWRTFLPLLRAHPIAILPITINPYTRCKSNNRLALSLWNGLAVVADPIPSYMEFEPACHLGNFEAGLTRYVRDPDLRSRDAGAGRAIVEERYSAAAIAHRWRDILRP